MPNMKHTIACLTTFLITLSGTARALTLTQEVTPASVKENPTKISIETKRHADGTIHFTIAYHTPQPAYVVATTEIRSGDKLLLQSAAPAFVREKSATFYITVAPERLAETKFNLFAGAFAESNGTSTPLPGGTEFQIQLQEFAKAAEEIK